MDPITFAVGAFTLISSIAIGIVNRVQQSHDNAKQLSLAQDSLDQNEKIAQRNFDLAEEQFTYQKELNDLTMQREDTAFQRQVADLKAAGLSPLMVAGGASANPLTSANAPQFDMSGINTAMGNMIGAYNDMFNRKVQREQFALQSRLQEAQTYTQFAELKMERTKANLENQYLQEKLNWEKTHGFRDLDFRSELLKIAEDYYNKNKGDINEGLTSTKTKASEVVDEFLEKLTDTSDDNYVSPVKVAKQTSKNTEKLHKEQDKTFSSSVKKILNGDPRFYGYDDDITYAIDYVYRHSKAHNDYDTVYKFKNALMKDIDIIKNYNIWLGNE